MLSDAGGKLEMLTALSASQVHDPESACALGRNVAEKLLNQGAQKLLDSMRDGGEQSR